MIHGKTKCPAQYCFPRNGQVHRSHTITNPALFNKLWTAAWSTNTCSIKIYPHLFFDIGTKGVYVLGGVGAGYICASSACGLVLEYFSLKNVLFLIHVLSMRIVR